MFPAWLHWLAVGMLALGMLCAAAIALDVLRHRQRMAIMNVVWPVTALYAGALGLWAYARYGRPVRSGRPRRQAGMSVRIAKSTLHCGSGCTLGDLAAEWLAFAFPAVATGFGWHRLFEEKIFAVWLLDFLFAFAFGIVFQYLAIVPMRHLSFRRGLLAAAKADALSLAAWQVGMYGAMALLQFGLLRRSFGRVAPVDTPEFWFAMQLAMLAGFVTAYPVNRWLIRRGLKEAM
ncbi:DUF4396 domain-containing protein [Fulvimonas yonginensis]|uniref:DUF4396 domain-containing protein n=1 Tax=Fulvimonas yonginensis TaxID=1495200 RepID=A0ABU8J7H3_9GAMM